MGVLMKINKIMRGNVDRSVKYKVGDVLALLYENKGGFWKVRKFSGLCIAKTGSGVNQRLTLRNILNGFPVEFSFYTHANSVIEIRKLPIMKNLKGRKSKLYYLRTKRTNLSKVSVT